MVSPEEAQAVLAVARRRRFTRGETVFHEGDPGDTLHLIDKGRVAIRVTTPLGDTATLRLLGPGQHFGELALVSAAPRNATVVALEAVETLSLHREHLDALRRSHPSVDRVLLEAVVLEVRRLSAQLLDALYLPVPKRIARCLAALAGEYRRGVGPVVVPLTQDDVASLCGTSRPTANKILKDLEQQGLVATARGRLSILDAGALAARGR